MGPSGEVDDFFNHSCDPNAGLKITVTKAVLVAIKDISFGQEILGTTSLLWIKMAGKWIAIVALTTVAVKSETLSIYHLKFNKSI